MPASQSTKARLLLTIVITLLMALVLGAGQASAGSDRGRDHRAHKGHHHAQDRHGRREIREHRREIRQHRRDVREHRREIREHKRDLRHHKREIRKHTREVRRHQRDISKHRHAHRRQAGHKHWHKARHRHRHDWRHGLPYVPPRVVRHIHHYYPRATAYRPHVKRPVRHHLSGAGHCNASLAGGLVGGGVGAALGALADDDIRPAAIVGGAVAGILVGSQVGKAIDASDRHCMGETLRAASDGSTITWLNPRTATVHSLTPTRSYETARGRYCREYISTATIGNRDQEVYGTACWQPDGSWEIVRTDP